MIEQEVLQKPAAARRTQAMLGQEEAWRKIRAARSPGDRSFQVALVRAEGGMGKTRLLERLLEDAGREVDYLDDPEAVPPIEELSDPLIGNLVDVINTRLHDRYRFVVALRESLYPYRDLPFGNFETANGEVKAQTAAGAQQKTLAKAQMEAVAAFVADLAAITQERRVVFLVDTVERLSYTSPSWLLGEGLLRSDDLAVRTHHWLQAFITNYKLDNITLILAGRAREGREFFARIESHVQAAKEAGYHCKPVDIELKRLSINQTRAYLAQLAQDYAAAGPAYRHIAASFAMAADPDQDQHKVIALLTGGVPVRLALYAQLITDTKTIPQAFTMSWREVCRQAELSPDQPVDQELPEPNTPRLRRLQWQVEGEFIDLLYRSPGDLRTRVLRVLVRAPRGLTALQLHYAIFAPLGQSPKEWAATLGQPVAQAQLSDLMAVLNDLAGDYIVKRRASWGELIPVLDENLRRLATMRIGLQDEIYRIYAEHMGLFAEPISEDTELVREQITAAERASYERNHQDEMEARQALYQQLADFAGYQVRAFLDQKRALLRADEEHFERQFRPEAPATYRFPELAFDEIGIRGALETALSIFEIERMIYRLLLDPRRNLNTDYMALTPDSEAQKASTQEEDFWAQSELWWAVYDPWLMKFVRLDSRDNSPAARRGETVLAVLRRVVEQEGASRWIRRFAWRGDHRRAVDFGRAMEAVIAGWPQGDLESEKGKEDYNKWGSWNHTLAREERAMVIVQSMTRMGREVPEAIASLESSIERLTRLYTLDVHTPAFDNHGHVECGFAAILDESGQVVVAEHPAHDRVRHLLASAHNQLGYSYRTLGSMKRAAQHYRLALEYLRVDRDEMKANRARVINNLSRVLSELGWNSLGICLNALEIRLELAEEVPLASSYNTLALINDDMGRYEDAPMLSAKAIAYCRRASEQRQLGLSLRQMAESLRHLAERSHNSQRAAPPDAYFRAAEALLNEARQIFTALQEAERLIEVKLEQGSLFRDRMQPRPGGAPPAAWPQYFGEADRLLAAVGREAAEHGMVQHVLDARVNQMRIYYFAKLPERLRQVWAVIEGDTIPANHIIKPHTAPPDPDEEALRDRNWAFRHLSAAQMILGWMAVDRFEKRVEELRDDTPEVGQERVARDPEAQAALGDMAEAYALGLAYAELYSPRSRSIGGMQNDLYRRMRKFNRRELNAFEGHLKAVAAKYPGLHSIAFLQGFLRDFFGGADITAVTQTMAAVKKG